MFFAEVDMKSLGGVLVAAIYGASSQDGLSWVRDQEPTIAYETQVEGVGKEYASPQVLHPFVMRWPEGGYLMFYNSHQRVFAAYSRDAVTWEKLGYTGIGGADADAILLANGSLRIYYGGWCQGEPECVDAGPGIVHTSLLKVILPPAEATVEAKTQATGGTPEKIDLEPVWQGGFLYKPPGDGPFPAVIYNHGGSGGNQIGGAPEETSKALADNGYVGFSPLRKPDTSLREKLNYIKEAVNYLKTLDYVDADRIGIMGFSQGGFLTFLSAAGLSDYKAVVIMASAVEILNGYLDRVDGISAPVLLLIAENDKARQNHVQAMTELNNALEFAGREVKMIVYPPYKDDGHQMFFEIGDYWDDVVAFLNENL